MKVTVGISNRHVHLTKETYEYIFPGKKLEKRNDLNQIGEFASTDTVTIMYNGKKIENVRIVGPLRSYNQVELLKRDIDFLGIDAPTRRSGDLNKTPGITIINGSRIIVIDSGVIRAERHIHVPKSQEDYYGLHERDKVLIIANGKEFTANVKVSTNGYYELHIDKDEAEFYGLSNGDEVEVKYVEDR